VLVERGIGAGSELAAERPGEADEQGRLAMLGLRRRGRGGGPLALRRRLRCLRAVLGRWVPEDPGGDPDRGHPIGHRVVDPADDPGAAALERQQVEPPQRAVVVEPFGKDLAGGEAEALVVERGAAGAGDVPTEVGGGVDPARPAVTG
jgi:hypothetical protein